MDDEECLTDDFTDDEAIELHYVRLVARAEAPARPTRPLPAGTWPEPNELAHHIEVFLAHPGAMRADRITLLRLALRAEELTRVLNRRILGDSAR
jgi:hypothetical protein